MTKARSTVDLLTLIGQAIEQLQRSIDAFEVSEQTAGVRGLSKVIGSIDDYLIHLEQDPLLQMATLDPGTIRGTLHGIQEDLSLVICEFEPPKLDAAETIECVSPGDPEPGKRHSKPDSSALPSVNPTVPSEGV